MKAKAHRCPDCRKNFIRQWRAYRGDMSQEQLAIDTGYSPGQINKIENGTAGYSPESLCAIAKALNCRPGDLLTVNPAMPGIRALWEEFHVLPDSQKLQIARVWRALQDDFRVAQ